MSFTNIKKLAHNVYKDAYVSVIGTMKDSQFYKRGTLTPNEFVEAGDKLVSVSPTWKWEAAFSSNKKNIDLPEKKQYLSTRVCCKKRVRDSIDIYSNPHNLEDGWILTEQKKNSEEDKTIPQVNLSNSHDEKDATYRESPKNEEISGNENCKEFEEFEEFEDIIIKITKKKSIERIPSNNSDDFIVLEEDSELRYYDITITYDNYYLTPRLWLFGYTENNRPLSQEEIFEDIVTDYAHKTATFETHPHLEMKQLSIHPCNHSNVMKRLIDIGKENGVVIETYNAMFLFLKFISSVIPTIEYDYTIDIDLSKK